MKRTINNTILLLLLLTEGVSYNPALKLQTLEKLSLLQKEDIAPYQVLKMNSN